MINPKKFAIYCSGNASRVIRFYTDTYNLETFFPNLVIYDGDSKDTLSTLLKMSRKRESRYARCGFLIELPPLLYYTISRAIATRNAGGFGCSKVERRRFCVSKRCDH